MHCMQSHAEAREPHRLHIWKLVGSIGLTPSPPFFSVFIHSPIAFFALKATTQPLMKRNFILLKRVTVTSVRKKREQNAKNWPIGTNVAQVDIWRWMLYQMARMQTKVCNAYLYDFSYPVVYTGMIRWMLVQFRFEMHMATRTIETKAVTPNVMKLTFLVVCWIVFFCWFVAAHCAIIPE